MGVTAAEPAFQTIRVKLSAGASQVDIYWRDTVEPAPLVIVAHGFSRRRLTVLGFVNPAICWCPGTVRPSHNGL
jgi:hypothetical protein